MFRTLVNAWKVPEIKKKMIFTIIILLIYRIGAAIPVPFIDNTILNVATVYGTGSIFTYLNILSGDAFSKATLFALSVSPYITAQIVVQLLTVAIPALERLSKEGPEGQKKINKITRYLTVGLALITSYGYYSLLTSSNVTSYYGNIVYAAEGFWKWFVAITIIFCYTAGAILIMWLGEKVDEQGIGNGISMMLFANIVCGLPSTISTFVNDIDTYIKKSDSILAVAIILCVLAVVIVVASILFITYMNDAERRIPIQYAKRVVGRKIYGGQNSNLPIKLTMSGVLPIIFASTLVSLPVTIIYFFNPAEGTFWYSVQQALSSNSWLYALLMFILIIAFAYFYTSITFNPVEVSNNIMQQGGSIPGIRPGKPTAQYISKILNKIVLMGAFFLGIISVVPLVINIVSTEFFSVGLGIVSFSGSTILIVVGVVLETFRDIESQLALRHYKGFLN